MNIKRTVLLGNDLDMLAWKRLALKCEMLLYDINEIENEQKNAIMNIRPIIDAGGFELQKKLLDIEEVFCKMDTMLINEFNMLG